MSAETAAIVIVGTFVNAVSWYLFGYWRGRLVESRRIPASPEKEKE